MAVVRVVNITDESHHNEINYGEEWYVLDGGLALGNMIEGGSLTVSVGGKAEQTYMDSGSLYICSGGIHYGILDIDNGSVTVEQNGIIDFTLKHFDDYLDPGEYLINDLSLIRGTPTYTITVETNQEYGTYKLAQGASGFNGSLSIGDGIIDYGSITVNGSDFVYNDAAYSLDQVGGNLTLTITEAEPSRTVCSAGGGILTLTAGKGFIRTASGKTEISGTLDASAWKLLGSGDFSGGGTDGLLWQEKATGYVYMQNDLSNFNEVTGKANCLGVVGEGYSILSAGDFTGNDIDGALLLGPAFGDSSVSLNYGLPIWGREADGTTFAGWLGALVNTWQPGEALKGNTADLADINAQNYMYEVVSVGDYNGDGVDDVMLQNTMPTSVDGVTITGSGDVFTFLTGDIDAVKAGASPTVAYAGCATGGWEIIGSGDFNGDGIDDVLLSDGTGVAGWAMANGQRSGDLLFGNLAAGEEIVEITDLNNDGTDDIIVLNTSTDIYSGWLIKNGSINGSLAIA